MAIDAYLPLSSLWDTLLAREETALTIARRVTMGTAIGDACIIAATPAAAAWYGLVDPALLIGQWISVVHHPDDARLGRLLSVARHFGHAVPTTYVSRLRQGNTHHFRPVLKQTSQLECDGETYWLTRLSEPHDTPLALQPHIWQEVQLVDTEIARHFSGRASVADLEQILDLAEAAGEPHEGGHPLVRSTEAPPTEGPRRPPRTAQATLAPLGPLLQHARQAQHLSLQALAQRCTALLGRRVTPQHLSNLEQGHRLPSLPLLQVLATVLTLDLNALVAAASGPAPRQATQAEHVSGHPPADVLARVQYAAQQVASRQQLYREALVAAQQAGYSLRQLAATVGLSPSRIRQLIDTSPSAPAS